MTHKLWVKNSGKVCYVASQTKIERYRYSRIIHEEGVENTKERVAHADGDFSLQFSGIEKYSLCRAIMPRPGQEAKYLYIGLQQKESTISSWILKIIDTKMKNVTENLSQSFRNLWNRQQI